MRQWILIVWCLCLPLLAQAGTHVALVSTCATDTGKDLLALAEAKLSEQPEIELVERRDVERVLREQNLWTCGLSDAQQALAAGQILGVQVFVALEVLPGEKDTLGLVCFAADSGARLMDTVLLTSDKPAAIANIVATVQAACAKQLQPVADRRTVCLLAVRNAGLPRALDGLCQAVGGMLERRLLSSSSMLVLERSRLDQINRERTLPVSGQTTNGLLASLISVELEFSRGPGSNATHVTVFQTGADGATTTNIHLDAALDQTVDLVESLGTQLVKSLNASPLRRHINRGAESARFCLEANFYRENGQPTQQAQAAEAAYALAPGSARAQTALAVALLSEANRIPRRGGVVTPAPDDWQAALAIGQRGMRLGAALSKEMTGDQALDPASFAGEAYGFIISFRGFATKQNPESRQLYTEILADYHCIKTAYGAALFAEMEQQSVWGQHAGIYFGGYLHDLALCTTSSEMWTSETLAALNRWVSLVDKIGICHIKQFQIGILLMPIAGRLRDGQSDFVYPAPLWSLKPDDAKRLAGFFEKLRQHPEPLLQLYGMTGALAALLNREAASNDTVQTQLEQIKTLAKAIIANPQCKDDEYILAAYQAMVDSFDLLADPALRQREGAELFDFMLARREYANWVALPLVDPDAKPFAAYESLGTVWPPGFRQTQPQKMESYAHNLQRLLTMVETPHVRELHETSRYWPEPFDQTLMKLRQRLAPQNPALNPKTAAPWSSAKLLWEGPATLLHPIVRDGAVWALAANQAPTPDLRFVRIPLDGGKIQSYDHIPLADYPDQHYAVATANGIHIFPPGDVAVSHYTVASGLPSLDVSAAVRRDGKLYAGLSQNNSGPGYLCLSDLTNGRVAILASSMRKEVQCPLDAVSPPFFVRQLVADPVRHRVLMAVDAGTGHLDNTYPGLWAIDTRTDQLTRLLPMTPTCPWISPIHNNEILLARQIWFGGFANYSIAAFNLATNAGQIIATTAGWDGDQALWADPPPPIIPDGTKYPHLILDGSLWSAEPFCRTMTNGAPREFLPSFTGQPLQNANWQFLELIDNSRQILAGVNNQLWLLTMPPKPIDKKSEPQLPPNKAKDSP